MANQWFRLYAEFATDPKVQMMSEAMQRRYIMLLCMRCSNSLVTLHDEEVAFQLRISAEELADTKALFIKKGFVTSSWDLPNWEKRQFTSDASAARVAKHRALQKAKQEKSSNVDVTLQKRQCNALEQNRTDTEQKRTEGESASAVVETPPTEAPPTPPLLTEYQKVIEANRPDLATTALMVWALFCETYPSEKRGIARWTKWVAEEKRAPPALQPITTPPKPGIDPTLAALLKESASGAVKPPSAEMRAKLAQLSKAKT